MIQQRSFVVGTALIVVGVILIWCSTLLWKSSPNWHDAGALAGGVLVLIAPVLFFLGNTRVSPELMDVMKQRSQFDQAVQEANLKLKTMSTDLDRRQRRLAEKYIAYQAWMELPLPNVEEDETPAVEQFAHLEADEIQEKDQAVIQLIEEETKRVFEDVKSNRFMKDDKFDIDLLRQETLSLITKVARVYNDESENPLLETSIDQLLRASSRASLHLLIVLEQLPLSVSSYNIKRLHGYIRQGVKAYGAYKRVEPFLPYVSNALHAGRLAVGVNPIAVGAWWAASKITTKGLRVTTSYVVNRQAIALLHDTVRVIGFEVAGIYGGDFRHRNVDWIYGVELSDLMSRVKPTRECLVQAMDDVGKLALSNEYDRVFLYRALASGKSGQPARFAPRRFLAIDKRREIVESLRQFAANHISADFDKTVARWDKATSRRLLED